MLIVQGSLNLSWHLLSVLIIHCTWLVGPLDCIQYSHRADVCMYVIAGNVGVY